MLICVMLCLSTRDPLAHTNMLAMHQPDPYNGQHVKDMWSGTRVGTLLGFRLFLRLVLDCFCAWFLR
jgi:hypothetical protein